MKRLDCFVIFFITLLLGACPEARADPKVEVSGATGFGALAVGITPARFAVSPSASVSLRGDGWFFVARDTVSFLGATGGRFGITNETSVGGGLFWERVNLSAGLSLAAFSLPMCGPRLCGQMRGLAPGADVRLDLFGPYLSGGLGISVDCGGIWITGSAASIWSGVSVRCSAGRGPSFVSPRTIDRPERLLHALVLWRAHSFPAGVGADRDRVQHGQPGRVLGQHVGRPRRLRADSDRRGGRRDHRRRLARAAP